MAAGHVYILINASMFGQLKIGMTERAPEDRARELSTGTGVPSPFMVAYSEDVPDCAKAEGLIHKRLDQFRTNSRREFFQLPLKDAIAELQRIAEDVRRIAEDARRIAEDARRIAEDARRIAEDARRSTPPVVSVSVAEPSAPLAIPNTPEGASLAASSLHSTDGGCGGVLLGVVILVIVAFVVRFVWFRAVFPVYEVVASFRTSFWVFMGTVLLVVMLWGVVMLWSWGAIQNKRRASK